MFIKTRFVSSPYIDRWEQQKRYEYHQRRMKSARAVVDCRKVMFQPHKFQYYLDKHKDKDKATRIKTPRQFRQRKPSTNGEPGDWVHQLNDCLMPPPKGTKVSPSAILLFPSPVIPNTRTPETLRQIIDDSGMSVLDESPLSAKDAYYARDIQGFKIKPPGPMFHVRPSPRPKSMRHPERVEPPREKAAQSERQRRPRFNLDGSIRKEEDPAEIEAQRIREKEEEDAKKKFEEQKKKFEEFDLDEFDLDKFNVDDPALENTNEDTQIDDISHLLKKDEEEEENPTNNDDGIHIGDDDNVTDDTGLKFGGDDDDNGVLVNDDDINIGADTNDQIVIGEENDESSKRETVVRFQLPE